MMPAAGPVHSEVGLAQGSAAGAPRSKQASRRPPRLAAGGRRWHLGGVGPGTRTGPRSSFLGDGVRLGRFAGVEVRVHWTWGIAASLIAFLLGSSVFPAAVPGLKSGTYYEVGGATAVFFFATLLLHELGHALVARRAGIPTRGVTLWMLGGVTQSEAPLPSAGTEARIALAGPAVTAVLGLGLVAAGGIAGLPAMTAVVLEWLGWTNLLLLAFNMVPALPLDGGRVLQAALWRIRGSEVEGTRAAVRVSRALSVALILIGLSGALVADAVGWLWLTFVGYVVYSACLAENAAIEPERIYPVFPSRTS